MTEYIFEYIIDLNNHCNYPYKILFINLPLDKQVLLYSYHQYACWIEYNTKHNRILFIPIESN